MTSILFTGFPGFLGSALLPRVLAENPARTAVCLVQPQYADLASRRVAELAAEVPDLAGRIRLAAGDLTWPDLGLMSAPHIERMTDEIYHLAAVYDLEVTREVGVAVNLEGTRRVLELAKRCPSLRRLHYVSTCYVSGRHPGTFDETDLTVGQSFNNHYEETKYLAEVEIRQAMEDGLPATIYRPAIVVGDSDTGATAKYDGIYYVIRFLLRQPRVAVMPMFEDPTRARVTLVPRDFVVRAITHLAGLEASAGRVYQLADPDPPTVEELVEILATATRRRLVRVRLPRGLVRRALQRRPVRRLVGIPAAVIDYFTHPTIYRTDRARADLEGSGITLPAFRSYVESLVSFVMENPDLESEAMV
ncbi:MAG: SDR family oxidoreductase [Gemmatimonadales bacterium]|jgi:thioester reductase-like protein